MKKLFFLYGAIGSGRHNDQTMKMRQPCSAVVGAWGQVGTAVQLSGPVILTPSALFHSSTSPPTEINQIVVPAHFIKLE